MKLGLTTLTLTLTLILMLTLPNDQYFKYFCIPRYSILNSKFKQKETLNNLEKICILNFMVSE